MKRYYRTVLVSLAALVPICLTSIYVISCLNAGVALSRYDFTNGLLYRVSNCGGNSAARTYCQNIALTAEAMSSGSGNTFDYTKLSKQQQDGLSGTDYMWTGDARYLIRIGSVRTGHDTHEIIVVCDTAFGNVPQPTIWNLHHESLRHAVGYSDGSVGWLTPVEFAALNRSNFVELPPRPKPIAQGTNGNSFE